MNRRLNDFFHPVKRISIAILLISIFFSCTRDDDRLQNKYLVDAQLIATVSASQILATSVFLPEINEVLAARQLTNVRVYKITYKTKNVDQSKIIASGALLVPQSSHTLPIISYQHGTLFDYNDAPSKYMTGLETRGLATIFSSAGYIVSVPDYIGYGVSENLEHPYEHAKSLATASFDMLMAVKEFIKDNDIRISDKLFLTGYSEGGGATMALHKYIEEKSDLKVTLSAPAAGAYNKTAFAREILKTGENLTFLPHFLWVIHSYNKFYKLNRNWSNLVNQPYATTLNAVSHPFNYRNAAVSKNPQELFTSALRNGILNETDTQFLNVLADNDVYDWKPKAPVRLYYGTEDDYVFPVNSETAYNAMKARGANVTLIAYDGLNHSTAFLPYIMDVFNLFETLK